ncbi:MAG: hypothetical protein VB858_17615 [Planctomycetaceae bacterium]|jgi:hypothetical protein
MKSTARLVCLVPLLAALGVSGCSTFNESVGNAFHDLKPHRLWRLNRHPAPRRDVYYSVSDPVPQPVKVHPVETSSESIGRPVPPQAEK